MGRIGIAFLLGVCCIHVAPVLPATAWTAALGVAFAIAAIARKPVWCMFLAGVGWAWLNAAAQLAGELPVELEGEDMQAVGYIASLPEASAVGRQFTFDVIEAPPGVPPRVQLTWRELRARLEPGELWRFTVRLKRRNGFANPGGFDYEGHLFRGGVGATGYVRDDAGNARIAPAGSRYLITQIRGWLAERIATALPAHSMLGVMQGLAIGDTRAMQPQQWRVFAATGTTHLMAISGLHITMVAALAAALGGAVVRWGSAQRRGWNAVGGRVIAGAVAALTYSALAGLSIPTQRTLVMLCVYFVARIRRRELSVGHALGLSLLGVLIVDPFAPLAMGAWLSFGAVAVILLATAGRLTRDSALAGFARVQAALTLGLTPLLLASFGAISLASPLANAIAVPLFTLVIVPTVLIGALAAALSTSLGSVVLAAPAWLLETSWPALERLAQHPFAVWQMPEPSMWAFVALAAGALLLVAPGPWMTRATGLLLCLPVALNRPAAPAPGDFELAVLDVGQGLASIVRTHSHTLVYDAGPAFQSGRDTGELVVTPYLRRYGVQVIDRLIISHNDLDHRGGARSIAEVLPVKAILHGPSVVGWPGELCRRGQRWTWDQVEFLVLHPHADAALGENDSSCVIRIRGRAGSALLTGDIEADAERTLADLGLAQTDIVVAPHHGSRTSSSEEFIKALSPQLAVFSAGYGNRWGFPKEDVVQRWREGGARTLSTAASGAIEAQVSGGRSLQIREHRKLHRRYWRRTGSEQRTADGG